MKSHETLYKIRSLEKMIIRLFIDEKEFIPEQCNLKKQKIFPTPTQMQIIAYILKHKNEDIYQRDLENVLKLRRATVSGVLKTMEKNGFITRITDKEDTRIKKIILNKNAEEIVNMIPLDRILIETDSPYLAPEPVRGIRNDSRNVRYIAQKIADFRNMKIDDIAKYTYNNACKIYNI